MSEEKAYYAILREAGLRVTPQRIAVLQAIYNFESHPSAERIAEHVKKSNPGIAVGTIYNILDSFVKNNIVKRVKTEKGAMLYDAIAEKHHHLYCNASDRIEDYYDQELDRMLEEFFKKKKIDGFEIEDIKLQLVGRFMKK